MKKLVTFILVVCLVLGMGTIAFAQPANGDNGGVPIPDDDTDKVVIKKSFVHADGTGGIELPVEEFKFKIEKEGVTDSEVSKNDMPMIAGPDGEFTISSTEGFTKLTLPTYTKVGVYIYKITEIPGTSAGVDYDDDPVYLKVYVFNDDEGLKRVPILVTALEEGAKTEGFTNTFSAGSLTVKKVVEGNMGQKDRKFNITVTLTGENVTAPIYVGGEEDPIYFKSDEEGNEKLVVEFTLADGEEYTISNIPYDVAYTVEEEDLEEDGYVTTISSEKGTISAAEATVTITNEKGIGIDTGVSLDNAPYIAILAVAIGGLVLFLIRRRMAVNL